MEVECPPWFYLEYSNSSTFSQCVCSDAMFTEITCIQRERTSFLKGQVYKRHWAINLRHEEPVCVTVK